jgi:predicted RNase H-like HicB family nuclease
MTGYAIIIEGEGDSFSAYAPELPGCIAAGSSVTEVEALMREAIALHLEVMREYGDEIPPPTTVATAIAEVAQLKS